MLKTDPSFRLVRVREDYPPLEDLELIGDGATVALVGLDGSIYWLCLPRFDSEPVFCGLPDRDRGGHFTITPDGLTEARQRYEPDTGARASSLGLLPEQIDPSTGEFTGNFPQAFSHIGVIASGVTLARAPAATGGHASMAGAPP